MANLILYNWLVLHADFKILSFFSFLWYPISVCVCTSVSVTEERLWESYRKTPEIGAVSSLVKGDKLYVHITWPLSADNLATTKSNKIEKFCHFINFCLIDQMTHLLISLV